MPTSLRSPAARLARPSTTQLARSSSVRLARWLASPLLGSALLLGDPGCQSDDAAASSPGAAGTASAGAAGATAAGSSGATSTAGTAGAGAPGAAGSSEVALEVASGTPIAYQLDWDWTGATIEGSSRIIETSLGYRLSIEALYTGTNATELIPCSTARRGRSPLGWLSPREAAADHSYNHDTTLIARALAETAAEEAPLLFGEGKTAGHRYCTLHLLSGPVADLTSDEFRLQGWSLYLRGSHSRQGSAPQPFEAFVGLSRGALRPLTAPGPLPSSASSVAITITRHVVAALDPIDLAALAPADLAFKVLERLGNTATVTVAVTP